MVLTLAHILFLSRSNSNSRLAYFDVFNMFVFLNIPIFQGDPFFAPLANIFLLFARGIRDESSLGHCVTYGPAMKKAVLSLRQLISNIRERVRLLLQLYNLMTPGHD